MRKYLDHIYILCPMLPVLLTADGQNCSDLQVHSPWFHFWHCFCQFWRGQLDLFVAALSFSSRHRTKRGVFNPSLL